MKELLNIIAPKLSIALFIVMCALMLTACGSSTVTRLATQQNLLVKCPKILPKIQGATGSDWELQSKQWAYQYHDCKTRHNGLVDSVNLFNGAGDG